MLKTRVLTAAIIALVAFAVVFLLPPPGFRVAIAALLLAGSWEYARLAALGRVSRFLLLAAQLALFACMFRYWEGLNRHALAFLTAGCLSWCLMLLRLVTYRPGQGPGLNYRFLSGFSALASLGFAGFALFWLHAQPRGEFLVLLLLFIIWAADIGAFFTGRQFGRHRLAPNISPGKTREGLLGGLLLALLVAIALARQTAVLPGPAAWTALLSVVTVLASAGGDLFISIHKRTVGLKDCGRLFPGHGGVLDRFDSLIAGAPFFALGVLVLEFVAK
jgi:phosphatidate cytidylyltransferase